jgi:low temperature requirement protein LtrA
VRAKGVQRPGAAVRLRYAVCAAQFRLSVVVSRDDPALRWSVSRLAGAPRRGRAASAASATDGALQRAFCALALVLDIGEPYVFGLEHWRLVPGHVAGRHGLIIIIIALSESIVAIGVRGEGGVRERKPTRLEVRRSATAGEL